MSEVFQYQGRVDPIPPSNFALPGDLGWLTSETQPVRRVSLSQPPEVTVEPIDQSLSRIPGEGAWLPPIVQPLPRVPYQAARFVLMGDGWMPITTGLPPVGGPYQIEAGHAFVSGGDVGQEHIAGGDVGQVYVSGGDVGQNNG